VDEVIKLMWHNMISQFSRLFLESWFTSHKQNDFNSYDPKNVALYVKVLFKDIHINVWQITISRPLTSPLHNEKIGYKHIVLFLHPLFLLSSFCIWILTIKYIMKSLV
jgi:hypothetical protein